MTPKLIVILCIIRESYAIHGHESTYAIGYYFMTSADVQFYPLVNVTSWLTL